MPINLANQDYTGNKLHSDKHSNTHKITLPISVV